MGFTSTRSGTGTRPSSARRAGAMAPTTSGRSSTTTSCRDSPTWGAARPTPGAARMVSRMDTTSSSTKGLASSAGSTGAAGRRSAGSPAWTISRRIYAVRVRRSMAPMMASA